MRGQEVLANTGWAVTEGMRVRGQLAGLCSTFCVLLCTSCSSTRQVSAGGSGQSITKPKWTIEMFKPYLNEDHNINDVQRAFPPRPRDGDLFWAGGAFIWITYRLSDGSTLIVGEHGAASATLIGPDGSTIGRFPLGICTTNEAPRPAAPHGQ